MSSRIVTRLCTAALAVAVLVPGAARAGEVNMGFNYFTGTGGEASREMAWNLSHLIEGDAVTAAEAARAKGCEAWVLEVKRRDAVLREHALSQSGLVDPSTRLDPSKLKTPNRMVDGTVTDSGGQVSWDIRVTNPDGTVVATESGSAPVADMDTLMEVTADIANRLVEKLCKKGFRLTTKYNDLVIDSVVCDLTKPFQVPGRGETAGLTFTLTPASTEGGAWAVGGSAGGVTWTGGGRYSQTLAEAGGKIALKGSWKITTPMGVFADSGTIPVKVARASGGCS